MSPERLVLSLERFGRLLPALVGGLPAADTRWRPPEGGWSLLEIVTHLADEEVEDFQTRLKHTLAGSSDPWPPIDPEGWALQRQYNQGSLPEVLARFAAARAASVAWLRGLEDPDWTRRYDHPRLGTVRAGDLLVSWAAHDALHLRQIAKRLYQLTRRDGGDYSPAYAGQWTA